ncbi:MAG: beta-galactosidase [Treponema sp.]|jgi:beta-galactosidase|nr:beta-galactosidase [Treponema sp.]
MEPMTYDRGQILLGGKPALLLSGEIHYFRLDPADWQDRLDKARECGLNTVAAYIPWLIHEQKEGEIDLEGRFHPRHNLKAFIELCEKNGFYLFLRPGPFIMAEMKNDGIPYWVYERCPEAVPRGFDGVPPTTPTLDYTEPSFLAAAKNWYRGVMGLIAEHTPNRGGNVIAIQLDNEIGMLSWVSNKPDLTANNLANFTAWLGRRYAGEELSRRYPPLGAAPQGAPQSGQTPSELFLRPAPPWDMAFHDDFAAFTRERYARYVQILKGYAEEAGVRDVQFVVNIHGTGGGRGFTYPIGVSQLEKTYAGEGNGADNVISGSDLYFDNMEMRNFQDIYLCNGITAASNPPGKPLTCVEFNAGDCNYGDDLSGRARASSGDFKLRLAAAQGNKLVNVYLFCGGTNYRFDPPPEDGNGRIATTGERHGFASPIGPDGMPNQNFPRLARSARQIAALGDKIARSFIEYDDTAYGFIPQDFATEYVYEKSAAAMAKKRELEARRGGNVWESSVRALLLSGMALRAANLSRPDALDGIRALVLPASKYMDAGLQGRILDFVNAGGSLLLHGRIPRFNALGEDCRILADALGAGDFEESPGYRFGYGPSIVQRGFLEGFGEYHCGDYETFALKNALPLLSVYENGPAQGPSASGGQKSCGFYQELGKGRAVLLQAAYRCYFPQYEKIKAALGMRQGLIHDISTPGAGVFMTLTKTLDGDEKFLYLINLDDIDKDFNVYRHGAPLFPRPIHLPADEALTLPLGVDFGFAKVLASTAELLSVPPGEKTLIFRNTEKTSEILAETPYAPRSTPHIQAEKTAGFWRIRTDNRLLDEEIRICFG